MTSRTRTPMAGWLAGVALACAATASPRAADSAPDIPGVVSGGTPVRFVASWDRVFGGEGPVPTPDGGLLLTHQGINKIFKIDKDGRGSTYLENTNGTTGLGFDKAGRLLGVGGGEHGSGVAALLVLAPTRSTLAEAFEGQPIRRPNDLVVDSKGGVYFTETIAPLPEKDSPPPPPGKTTIFYFRPDGRLVKAIEEVPRPNGIQLSPDEKTLYVINVPGDSVMALDVMPDGHITNMQTFATFKGPRHETGGDGLAVDASGRLYAATAIGVQVFGAHGDHLGTIPIPVRPTNLAFAGPKKQTLFVVCRGAVHRISMLAKGLPGRAK
jgi:gluconolactonase